MILIVDDKQENLISLKKFLESNNFKVHTASSGEDALKKVLKTTYALIILDVQMPGMDGFEVAELISGYSKAVDTPIIFLSAVNTEKKFITKGYETGGIDYLTKPFDPDILLLKVKTFYRLFEQAQAMHNMQETLKQEIEHRKLLENKKDEFISIASHELKTPLTSVRGYLQLLERLPETTNNEKYKKYLAKTSAQLDKLRDLIDDLLDISKIESGKMKFNFQHIPIKKLVDNTIENISQMHPKHTFKRYGDVDTFIYGDEMRLEQVLINYLTNAIKYSPNSTEIHIESKMTHDHKVQIGVRDFGIGIPPDKISNLFDKFYRVEESSYKFQGLGMGLYICKEIIARHKGEYGVESELNKGSLFYFRLPLN
ncbi:hybrid sensor histidine kinase/response regulator [Olivibacter sp. SDN3]|uniref:ATP-binding response regulator n=1 Tax=Olivibacter sp. SDN3 TaxID=2764720 RepID=UPI001650E292|nr:hybrid sensor histidine kinase/response regulator [Olivibacter sp. SDN3]QNL52405.1 hybrid sensor histidine kinase/response regulator [Olivibacter sp. SDN3]